MNLIGNEQSILRILIVGVLAYVGLIVMLRISGNRTLSKMNSFDFVTTIALGSTLSSGLLQKSVPLTDTLFAFALLIGLQYFVTWWSVRSERFRKFIKSKPRDLMHNGVISNTELKSARVTEDEIQASLRQAGLEAPDEGTSVALETNGKLTVFRSSSARSP